MPGESYLRMKEFYEKSEIGHQMAAPLKENAVAWIDFEDDEQTYELIKIDGRTAFRPKQTEKADIYFRFSKGSIAYLFEPPSADAEAYVNRLCDCLLKKDPAENVEVKLLTSLIDGWRKGYISMMKLGGKRGIATVARIGIRIPGKYFLARPTEEDDEDDD